MFFGLHQEISQIWIFTTAAGFLKESRHNLIAAESAKCRKAQTEFNVFFNTPQSNTGQNYANAIGVNARLFLSVKKQQAFRPLIAYQKSRNGKKLR